MTGKTTLINFVLDALSEFGEDQQGIIVVRFEPWWFSGTDQLVSQFFRQLEATLGQPNLADRFGGIAKHLETLEKALVPLKFVPGISEGAGAVRELVQAAGEGANSLAEMAEKDLQQSRRAIDTALREQRTRLLVVIDDIDRLRSGEITQIFQLVKAVANFPNIIYLLSFDREVVVQALDDVQHDRGEEYLEKIVQVSFDLPPADRGDVRKLLFSRLDRILGEGHPLWEPTRWGNIFHSGIDALVRTTRDINRYANALALTYPLVREEVNPMDFLGIECIRIFAPTVYEFVSTHKDLLTGEPDDRMEEFLSTGSKEDWREERKQLFDTLLEPFNKGERTAVSALLGRLFPRFAAVYDRYSLGPDYQENWRRARRICSPDVFDVYFRLAVASGDVRSVEMAAILGLASQPERIGERLLDLARTQRSDGSTRLRGFFERLPDYEDDIPNDHVAPLLKALFAVGDDLLRITEVNDRAFGNLPNANVLAMFARNLAGRLSSQEERFSVLQPLLRYAKATYLATFFVMLLGMEHGKYYRDQAEPEEGRLVNHEQLSTLEVAVGKDISASIADGSLTTAPYLDLPLQRLADWGDSKEAVEYAARLIQTDEGLVALLRGFTHVKFIHRGGNLVSETSWNIDANPLTELLLIDLDELLPRCQTLLERCPEWLTPHGWGALDALVREVGAR